MAKVDEVEGIGAAYAAKLAAAGVATTDELLECGKDAAGRQGLSQASGVSEALVLEWVNHCDLMRVKGVGSEYADLREAAGVDSVPELAQRNPANLAAAVAAINGQKRLVRQVPSENVVSGSVAEAKTLPRIVTH